MPLPLTHENLNLLLTQYENKIDQLDTVTLLKSSSNTEYFVNYHWHSTRNRFFDVRYDNPYCNTDVFRRCRCKCPHGILARTENTFVDVESKDDVPEYCQYITPVSFKDQEPRKPFMAVPACKICRDELWSYCDCDFCSEGTYEDADFINCACPEKLVYEMVPNEQETPFDGISDPNGMRVNKTYDHNRKDVVTVASIPIIERNLVRLDKEFIRQEAHKQCMIKIRNLAQNRNDIEK